MAEHTEAGFTSAGRVNGPFCNLTIYNCDTCAALVGATSLERHRQWHEHNSHAIQFAAMGWGGSIGG